jgi:apolipoprotein N-acyltransferase
VGSASVERGRDANTARAPRALAALAALAAGAATVFGFAPFGVAFLPSSPSPSCLRCGKARRRRERQPFTGYAFGLGLFGAGASWVFVALNTFGGMPWPLAGIGTCRLLRVLALYPAATGWLATRWTRTAILAARDCRGCAVGDIRMGAERHFHGLPVALAGIRIVGWSWRHAYWRAMLHWAACSS